MAPLRGHGVFFILAPWGRMTAEEQRRKMAQEEKMLRTKSIVWLTITLIVSNIVVNLLDQLFFVPAIVNPFRFIDTSLYIGLVGGFLAYQSHCHPDYDTWEE